MTLEQKAKEQAIMLRKCSDRGACTRCPLDDYVGCCTDKLKADSAELIEDQQAVIQALSKKVGEMIASITQLRDKYSTDGEKEKRN